MRSIRIGCLQLKLKKSNNFEYIKTAIESFKGKGCDLLVLSELAVGGPGALDENFYFQNYEKQFCEIAKDLNLWLIPGTFYEKKGLDVFNIAPIIDRRGSVVSKAKKNFPWLPYEKNVACSETPSVINFENKGKLGVHICYDLWFPESSRAIALAGAELIINPTLTPTKDRDIEKIMVQATAAQQQLFYIDINSTGDQGCGHSIVCNPDGEIMHESTGEEDLFVVDIDLDHAQESRLNGIYGLGQPIKSFRDHSGFNKMYPNKDEEYLKSLGKLEENKK